MQEGNCSQGKMSPLGWRNLVKRFHERTGWKHDKGHLLARYRQLKTFYTCLTVLQSGTGGGRAGGGYQASNYVWDHFSKKLKEIERLKFEEPTWAQMLPAMFVDVAIDYGSVFVGIAADRESEDTPAPENTSQRTSGSRKRDSSGATKSTANSPSKKEQPSMSPPRSSRSKKTKSVLASIFSKLRADDEKATKALTHLSEKPHQTNQEQREAYRQCLELALDCGIDEASEEYFFLSEKFKDEHSRDSYLILKTREARWGWIERAFERRHRN